MKRRLVCSVCLERDGVEWASVVEHRCTNELTGGHFTARVCARFIEGTRDAGYVPDVYRTLIITRTMRNITLRVCPAAPRAYQEEPLLPRSSTMFLRSGDSWGK
jgi:hypothetical protein